MADKFAEILDNTPNRVVVHCPGREYPGLVIQGDTLHQLCLMANDVELNRQGELKETLADLADHYNFVCKQHPRT
jgi:hypothetical protein